MMFRRTLQWFFVLLFLALAGGGGYAYWLWSQSNEMLRRGVLEKIAEIAPDWNITVDSARFDWSRHVHVYGLRLYVEGDPQPIAELPHVELEIDRELLNAEQKVLVQEVRAIEPLISLRRNRLGEWNFHKIPPLPKSDRVCPDLKIEQGRIELELFAVGARRPTTFNLDRAEVQLVPSAKRRYTLQGSIQVPNAGQVDLAGDLNVDERTWSLSGQSRGIALNSDLVDLVTGFSAKARDGLMRLRSTLREYQPSPVRTVSAVVDETDDLPEIDVSGLLDLDFRIARAERDAEPELRAAATVANGAIASPALPFDLKGIAGRIVCDNRRVSVEQIVAQSEDMMLQVRGGSVRSPENPTQYGFTVEIAHLPLDSRLQSRLWGRMRRLYDSLRPSGYADIRFVVSGVEGGSAKVSELAVVARNCTCAHERFPYPVESANGTVRQEGDVLHIAFEGRASQQPVVVLGTITNPGAESEIDLKITVQELPIDSALFAACPPEARRVLDSLQLGGIGGGVCRIYRPRGLDQKLRFQLDAALHDGTLEYERFPYRISELTGALKTDSATGVWEFNDLKGRHETAHLTGTGYFRSVEKPGLLKLDIRGMNVPLDQSLQTALPDDARDTWDHLQPSGRADITVDISWVPGQQAQVNLPQLNISDGTLEPRSFPYRLTEVNANAEYADGRATIHTINARHDQTRLQATAFFQQRPDRGWQLNISDIHADEFMPDRTFREALLSERLRNAVEQMNPRGPLTVTGAMDFKGIGQSPLDTTAAWELQGTMSDSSFSGGPELEHVRGIVTSVGNWDGQVARMDGRIELDNVSVKGYRLNDVRGPYQLVGDQLTLGSKEAVRLNPRTGARLNVPDDRRITAHAIGGTVTIDAAIVLQEQPSYKAKLTLSQGRLEQFAQEYLAGLRALRGMIDSWVDLQGRGESIENLSGSGQIMIAPAALYELPVLVAVLKWLSITDRLDKVAFNQAFADFDINQSKFQFRQIALDGDAISLRGRGYAGFDGALSLIFASQMPRNQLPGIPILSWAVGEATKGLVGVRVEGTIKRPEPQLIPVPALDDAVKGLFDTNPVFAIPRMVTAPIGTLLGVPPQGEPLRR